MKSTIRHLGIFLVIVLLTNPASAQFFRIASTIPMSPTIYDSIFIVDSLVTPSTGYVLYGCRISMSNNDIVIKNCYYDPAGFDIHYFIKGTIPIGKLAAGFYSCILYSREYVHANINDPIVQCDSLAYIDSFKFSFTVSRFANGAYDLNDLQLTISPNPTTDRLYLNTSLPDLDLTISDMTGRVYIVPYSQREIDVSSLSAGIYCLRLQDRRGSIVRRFVKQ